MEAAVSEHNGLEGMFAHDESLFDGTGDLDARKAVVAVFGITAVLCAFGIACGKSVDLQFGPLSVRIG